MFYDALYMCKWWRDNRPPLPTLSIYILIGSSMSLHWVYFRIMLRSTNTYYQFWPLGQLNLCIYYDRHRPNYIKVFMHMVQLVTKSHSLANTYHAYEILGYLQMNSKKSSRQSVVFFYLLCEGKYHNRLDSRKPCTYSVHVSPLAHAFNS